MLALGAHHPRGSCSALDLHLLRPVGVEALDELLDQGRPFSAHEVFEARWKDAPEAEHDLWQGLAQLCVGLTHALRGNATGAGRLLERGNGRLERYAAAGGPTYGLDLAEFRTLPYVSTPGAPAQTKAAFVLEDGQPGLQPA